MGRRTSPVAAVLALLSLIAASAASAGIRRPLDTDLGALLAPSQSRSRVRVENVPLKDGLKKALLLERFEAFAPGASIAVYGVGGRLIRHLDPPDVRYFRGEVEGDDEALAFIAISRMRVEGYVMYPDRRFSFTSRVRNQNATPKLEVVVVESEVSDEMAVDGKGFTCDADDSTIPATTDIRRMVSAMAGEPRPDGALNTGTARWLLNLAIETDYELFVSSGSNVGNVNTFVGNLVAAASTIYQRDLRTDLVISHLGIHSAAGDPFAVVPGQTGTWDGSPVAYTSSHALAELGDRWANAGTRPFSGARSSTILLSGKPQAAGVAWIGTLCGGDFTCSSGNCGSALFNGHTGGRYAYCGGIDPPADLSVPNPDGNPDFVAGSNYWPLLQFTHELGHNVGSGHTHCIELTAADQVTYGRTFVDHCVGGCAPSPYYVPAEKGTIMSYCHLSGGGSQTRYTFGQSGEASHVVPEAMQSDISFVTPTLTSAISAPASLSAGGSATASVTGSGVSSWLWTVSNGTIDSGQGTSSIEFTASADPVTLEVRATNSVGCAVTDRRSVTVSAPCVPPSVTSQPASVTILPGQTATLSVSATGTAPLGRQWYLGVPGDVSQPLPGATATSVSVSPATTALYWVLITNSCGVTNSAAATVTVNPASTAVDVRSDFNGNGYSDILLRNSSTGAVAMWTMNGTTITNSGLPFNTLANPVWHFQGLGDFNGDGYDDVFIRNASTGRTVMWEMQGETILNRDQFILVGNLNWSIEAFGDTDGDGIDEIIWRHMTQGDLSMWNVNGHSLLNSARFARMSDLNWQLQVLDDFNGDGNADILWRNDASGALAIWFLDGRTILNSGKPFATFADPDWQIAGSGDFNGDGRADLFWRNAATGENLMWEMSGQTIVDAEPMPGAPANWVLQFAGADYNGDGRHDVLWRNTTNGDLAMWLLNGHALLNSGVPFASLSSAWDVQPPAYPHPDL